MNNYLTEDQISIMETARAALKKVKNVEKSNTLLQEMTDFVKTMDVGQMYFEEFDPQVFTEKQKIDKLVYSQLTEGKFDKLQVDESRVNQLIESLYNDVNQIYEFINIKPEVLTSLDQSLLECSLQETKQKISGIIYEHLDKRFYSLSPKERVRLYLEDSRECIKNLVVEGEEIEEVTSFCVKKKLMEGFLKRVAFPFGIWERIQFLSESEDYGRVFDQDKLISLVEDFNIKLDHISSIVSAVI